MKNVKWSLVASAVGLAVSVAGCGGGGGGKSLYGDGSNGTNGNGVSNVSSEKATQRSVSFSASDYQLDWSSDGKTATVTIRVADTAGNPLPAGTKIQFSASGGQIEKTCSIGTGDAGASGCSVNFSTQNPRPGNGIVSIVAWMVGEEAYRDLNGNGKYDAGEPFFESGKLFRDDNASFDYTDGADELVVGTTLAEDKVGVGTSACREDTAAEPTEIPMSVPNTCDGVWGKTLIRAQAYFAVSDSNDLGVEAATVNNLGVSFPSGEVWARVYTLAPNNVDKVAAVSGSTVTVTTAQSGCTVAISNSSPSSTTIRSTAVWPTYHQITKSGTCTGATAVVTVTEPVTGRAASSVPISL